MLVLVSALALILAATVLASSLVLELLSATVTSVVNDFSQPCFDTVDRVTGNTSDLYKSVFKAPRMLTVQHV